MPTDTDTWPAVVVNRLDDGTYAVWCDVCDRQVGDAGYDSEDWANELAKAHRSHH